MLLTRNRHNAREYQPQLGFYLCLIFTIPFVYRRELSFGSFAGCRRWALYGRRTRRTRRTAAVTVSMNSINDRYAWEPELWATDGCGRFFFFAYSGRHSARSAEQMRNRMGTTTATTAYLVARCEWVEVHTAHLHTHKYTHTQRKLHKENNVGGKVLALGFERRRVKKQRAFAVDYYFFSTTKILHVSCERCSYEPMNDIFDKMMRNIGNVPKKCLTTSCIY